VGFVPRASGVPPGTIPRSSGTLPGSTPHTSGALLGTIPHTNTARPTTLKRPAFAITSTVNDPNKEPTKNIATTETTVCSTKPPTAPAHTLRAAAGEVWQDPTLADWDPNDFRIFVGDLGPEVTDMMLQQAFSRFGSLTKYRIIRDRKSSKSKGYGFVGFKEPQDFLAAIREMNGKSWL
jgi:hypothetical protein